MAANMMPTHRFGLCDGLQRQLFTNKDKLATSYKGKDETFTELWEQTQRLSSAFQKDLGMKVGDLVSIAAPNCLEFVHTLTALDRVGAVCLPIPHMLTAEELAIVLNQFQPSVLFLHSSQIEKFQSIQGQLGDYKPKLYSIQSEVEGMGKFADLYEQGNSKEFTEEDIVEDALQLVLLTSGTTGHPKGVMKTYRNMYDSTVIMASKMGAAMESIILYNSLAWIGGNGIIWGLCLNGVSVILMDGYDKVEYLDLLQKHKVGMAFLLPQPFVDFAELSDEKVKELLTHLKVLIFGGGTISPAAIEMAFSKFQGCFFSNSYGMTEGGFVSGIFHTPLNLTPPFRHLLGSVGRLNPGVHALIADEDGKALPFGESGEILLRSSAIMKGYYKNEEATAKAFRNGWFRTGDVGMLDKDGYLYIQDRIKDVVKTPEGYNIYPIEIETVLDRREDVLTSAVIGVPKADGNGEILVGCLVKKGDELSSDDLKKYCAEHVAEYKVPQYFLYFDEFSYNRNNKVDKRKMRKRAVDTGKIAV